MEPELDTEGSGAGSKIQALVEDTDCSGGYRTDMTERTESPSDGHQDTACGAKDTKWRRFMTPI